MVDKKINKVIPKKPGIRPFASITIPIRRDGYRITQDWFNDIRDALLSGVVSPGVTGIVVGDTTDVANGDAVYSSIQAAHDASTTTDLITLLARTWLENLTWTKCLQVQGRGYKSVLDGSIVFATGSEGSGWAQVFFKGDITINTDVYGIFIEGWGDETQNNLTDNSGLEESNFWLIQRN
jgi:hypothetical protein